MEQKAMAAGMRSAARNGDRIIVIAALPLAHAKRVRNAKRVVQRRVQDSTDDLIRFSINVPAIATVVLIIYSEQPERFRDDTPIHAISAELWVGTQKQAEIEPIVCLGMRGDKVTALFPQILEAFTQQFARTYNEGRPFYKFAAKIHRHIRDCSIVSPFQPDSRQ